MNNWLNQIHQGHALEVLRQMPDGFVDACVTSPPYWGLRDYQLEPIVWDDNKYLQCISCNSILEIYYSIEDEYEELRVLRKIPERTAQRQVSESKVKSLRNKLRNQTGFPRRTEKVKTEENLRNLQWENKGKKQKDLQQEMRSPTCNKRESLASTQSCEQLRGNKYELERGQVDKRGIYLSFGTPESPDKGKEKWQEEIHSGTQISNGETFRPLSLGLGESSSQKFDQNGQQNRELGDSDRQGSSKDSQWRNPMSTLPEIICPECGSKDLTKYLCEHEWQIKKHKDNRGIQGSNLKGRNPYEAGEARLNYQSAFCSKCGVWKGSLGLEPTPELYLRHLLQIFDEVRRVLKNEGTLWVNLGDSYAGSGGAAGHTLDILNRGREISIYPKYSFVSHLPAKSLCLIPQRFAIAMSERGWILRNEIHWHKSNPMPESVKDRFTRDFEHVFFFVKQGKYFFEQQFEQFSKNKIGWLKSGSGLTCYGLNGPCYPGDDKQPKSTLGGRPNNHGRNMRTTWDINPEPFTGSHFATFPTALVERCLLAGCPAQICSKCGKGRKKIYASQGYQEHPLRQKRNVRNKADFDGEEYAIRDNTLGLVEERKEIGLTDCGCGAPWTKGIALDPFLGSGTTAVAAMRLNRDWIGIELSEKYCKLAEERLSKPIQVRS